MPEFFALVNIGNMYFEHRRFNCSYCISYSYRSMCIRTGVHHNAVYIKTYFVQFVNNFALYITLVIIYGDVCVAFAQVVKVAFEAAVALNGFLANAEQVQVGAVDYLYIHYLKLNHKTLKAKSIGLEIGDKVIPGISETGKRTFREFYRSLQQGYR